MIIYKKRMIRDSRNICFHGVQEEWIPQQIQKRIMDAISRVDENLAARCLEWDRVRPSRTNILEAFKTLKPAEVRVIIIGQDPYPHRNDATGIAFHAPHAVSIPRSARSIFDNLAFWGHITPEERMKIRSANFSGWIGQGVLMVNTSLTIIAEEPGSHIDIWKNILSEILSSTDADGVLRDAVVLKLGTVACAQHVACSALIEHCHPVIPSDSEFKKYDCFGEVNRALQAQGKKPINWADI